MIPNSSKEDAGHEQKDIPKIWMEQDVKTEPGDAAKKCYVGKRFESYDEMMAVIDDLKAHNHPHYVYSTAKLLRN